MKKLTIIFLLTFAVFNSVFAGTQSAAYYLNTPEKYLGKKITLYTTSVERSGAIENLDGVLFQAYTMGYNDEFDTKWAYVLVPKEKASAFARRYGQTMNFNGSMGKIKKVPMTCVLRQAGNQYYFAIE